jgi:hypothetical protein
VMPMTLPLVLPPLQDLNLKEIRHIMIMPVRTAQHPLILDLLLQVILSSNVLEPTRVPKQMITPPTQHLYKVLRTQLMPTLSKLMPINLPKQPHINCL